MLFVTPAGEGWAMQVKDVMTTDVVTVEADTSVSEVARTFLEHRISGAPVLDGGRMVGIVSEGDLLRRVAGEDHARSWWLRVFAPGQSTRGWIKEHGRKVRDVMTQDVVTVSPSTLLSEAAGILERRRIKRLPVIANSDTVVGIVSRANLIQGLASAKQLPETKHEDRDLRDQVLVAFQSIPHIGAARINVTVKDGVAELWGFVDDDAAERAAEIAAENVPGIKRVEMNLGRIPTWAWAD